MTVIHEFDIREISVTSGETPGGENVSIIAFPQEYTDSLVPHLTTKNCGGSFSPSACSSGFAIEDAIFTSATKTEIVEAIKTWLKLEGKEYQRDGDRFFIPRLPQVVITADEAR
jgi:hypothetical protein